MNSTEILGRWTKEKSEELYGINNWGNGYFSVSAKGEVQVSPEPKKGEKSVSLMDIISGISDRGFDTPVLLRFENILDAQIAQLNNSFAGAIKELGYQGKYRGVYPIKVNQQQQVIYEVAKYGQKYHHGFEVGSKPELIAALSEIKDKESCLICNGYKDEEFIDLGLYAIKMGFQCYFVIEMPGELDIIIERSKAIGVKPNIGVRIKLASVAGGHWAESGGERSIFGLNISQVTEVIDALKANDMLDTLKLLHYHLGSQIPNIRDIRSAVREASRVYAELVKEGAPMGYIDLGGGLAVDYDGSKTNYDSSRNYSLKEYTADVVEAVMSTMDQANIPHPTIITESGRWIVAYYSVLIFNVLDTMKFETYEIPESIGEGTFEMIENLFIANQMVSPKNLQECYNDALYYRDRIREAFNLGKINIREMSFAEKIFWNTISKVNDAKKKVRRVTGGLESIERGVTDIYYCNFSVFQSIPDSWAIDHLFPVMPLHRLGEQPMREAVIADITCDCDGKIDKFIDLHDIRRSLPVHELEKDKEYFLGAFLVGAYQETLGDLHNLFGDTNVVSVRITKDGQYELTSETQGDTVEDVLSYVEFDVHEIRRKLRKAAEEAVQSDLITPKERKKIMTSFENGLDGYTYYEK